MFVSQGFQMSVGEPMSWKELVWGEEVGLSRPHQGRSAFFCFTHWLLQKVSFEQEVLWLSLEVQLLRYPPLLESPKMIQILWGSDTSA